MKIANRVNLVGFFWAINFAVLATMGSALLERSGAPRWEMGVHGGAYYLSAGVAALAVPSFFRFLSIRGILLLGVAGSSFSALLFPFFESHLAWLGFRIMHGVSSAILLVSLEILVFQTSAEGEKAKCFGLFEICLAFGAGIGASVSPLLEDLSGGLPFLVSGNLTLITAFFLPNSGKSFVDPEQEAQLSLGEFLHLGFCYGTAFTQGFLEGGILAYFGVALVDWGFDDLRVSMVFAAMFAGIIASMFFVTRLADCNGQVRVLWQTHLVSVLALGWIYFDHSFLSWVTGMFLVGLAVGGQYAIALGVIGRRVSSQKQPAGNSLYLAINCAGSVGGPLMLGASQISYSSDIMPLLAGVPIALLLTTWTIMRLKNAGWTNHAHQ